MTSTRIMMASSLLAVAVAAPVDVVHTQQQFALYLSASDEKGRPITDLQGVDVLVRENGREAAVVRFEEFRWPVKVTVLVDNGLGAQDSLIHYRTGLRQLFDALPPDLETALIATAPNPRWLARPTRDRAVVRRGIDLLTIDETLPRSNDAFVEYAERLGNEFRLLPAGTRRPYLPILVSISTNSRDGSTVTRDPLLRMLKDLVTHQAIVHVVMLSRGGVTDTNDGTHVLVAKAAQELTGGRYDALAISSRLLTLLPEIGRQIAAMHVRQTTQYRMTVERPAGATGTVRDLQLSIARKNATYMVSADGSFR